MGSIDEERNAVEQAERAIHTLSVSPSPQLEAILETLRNAKDLATRAGAGPTFSSEGHLNEARGEAGIALSGLIHELKNGPVTQETIDRAKCAVEDWKHKLAVL
jgi:hypothetical protein